MLTPFHLAIGVSDLGAAETFYTEVLGCTLGRRSTHWIDFNLFGHQLVCHEVPNAQGAAASNPVDGEAVPVPHFGVVLNFEDWEALANTVTEFIDGFIIEPYVRFKGEPGEQGTMFFIDPSGNALEFKAFKDIDAELFAK